jgi:hypothetical protein
MFDAMMKAIITLTLFGATFADNCNPYTQIKPGVITYEVDDGGCFFCGNFPQSQFPLEGDDLAHHCKQMSNVHFLCSGEIPRSSCCRISLGDQLPTVA